MLIDTFAILQVVCFILFWVSYKIVNKYPFDVLFWTITIAFAGILAFQSMNIEQQTVIISNSTLNGITPTYNYSVFTAHTNERALTYLNIGIGSLGILFFFLDLYQGLKFGGNSKNEKKE